jgi:hypothetical protein
MVGLLDGWIVELLNCWIVELLIAIKLNKFEKFGGEIQ